MLRHTCFNTPPMSLGAALRGQESRESGSISSPLANKPVPRTPASLQAGSRKRTETLYFLKDSWRGRRDSNPRPPA